MHQQLQRPGSSNCSDRGTAITAQQLEYLQNLNLK